MKSLHRLLPEHRSVENLEMVPRKMDRKRRMGTKEEWTIFI